MTIGGTVVEWTLKILGSKLKLYFEKKITENYFSWARLKANISSWGKFDNSISEEVDVKDTV